MPPKLSQQALMQSFHSSARRDGSNLYSRRDELESMKEYERIKKAKQKLKVKEKGKDKRTNRDAASSPPAPATSNTVTSASYIHQHELKYQPCCQEDRLILTAVQLSDEKRQLNQLMAVLLTAVMPTLRLSRYEWCHLLRDDACAIQVTEPRPSLLDRLERENVISIKELKSQFTCEWREDQESRQVDTNPPLTTANLNTSIASASLNQQVEDDISETLAYTSNDCCICWDHLRNGTTLFKLRCCRRLLHLECLARWSVTRIAVRRCIHCMKLVSQEELTCIQSEMKVEIKRSKFCKRIDRLKEQESNTAALASSDLDSTFADDDFNFKLNDHFQSTNSNPSSRCHRVQANPPISYSRGLTSYQKRAQAIQADEMKQFGYLLQKRKPISQYWAGAKLFQDEKDSSNTLESDGELQSYIWDWMQSKSAALSAQEQFTEDEAKRRWPTKDHTITRQRGST